MLITVVVVVLVAVVAAGAPFLDRAAAARAEARASAYLTEPFGGPAEVRVVRRPFLSQVVRGRYQQIDVTGRELRFGELTGATLVAHLSTVYLPLRELLGRRTREIVCERVRGRVVLPYDEIARLAPVPGLRLRFGGERLTASAAVPLPGLNQIVRVRGEAVLTHAGEGTVWLRIDQVSLVGIALPSVLWNQLLPTLNFPIALPELPYGLRIDELRPTASGLVVDGSADAVTFRRLDE